MKKGYSGFTLIELLMVVVILTILTSVVIVNFGSMRQKSRDANRKADLSGIRDAIYLFYSAKNYFPSTDEGIPDCAQSDYGPETAQGSAWSNLGITLQLYVPDMPVDPSNKAKRYCSGASARIGNGGPTYYELAASLETDSGNGEEIVRNSDIANPGNLCADKGLKYCFVLANYSP